MGVCHGILIVMSTADPSPDGRSAAAPTIASAHVVTARRDGAIVHGADAARYLHGQASSDIDSMIVGDSCWTLLLQPTGKIDVLARVTMVAGDRFVLDTDDGFGDQLVARLNRFRIRVAAEVESRAFTVSVAAGPADPLGTPTGQADDVVVAGWWNGRPHVLSPADAQRDVPPDDADGYEPARIAAGWPAMGTEMIPGETIPGETALIGTAVTLGKGCYPGQELVERMDSRAARAPRQLRIVDVEPGAGAGDPVVVDGVTVGRLTSVSGTIGLGYVKRGAEVGRTPGPAG